MAWYWECSYIQSVSQREVLEAIRKTVLALTDNLEEVDCNSSRYRSIHPWLRAFVSPRKDDWVAIWGLTDYLYNRISMENKLFGVTIAAECPSNIDEESAWEMIVWKDGSIQSWYISDVQKRIENVYRELLANAYGKMLLNYLGYKDEEFRSINLENGDEILLIVEKNSKKFSNNLEGLSQFIRSDVTNDVLKAWLSLPDYEAMVQIARIFSFPYLGLHYREDIMAHYYDVHQGFGKHYDDYEFAKSLHDIDKYQPVGFKERNKNLKPLEMSDSIFSLVSYQSYIRRP